MYVTRITYSWKMSTRVRILSWACIFKIILYIYTATCIIRIVQKKRKMRRTVANQLLINSMDSKMAHVTRPLVKWYFSVATGNRISSDATRVSVLEMLQRRVRRPLSQRNATVFCFPERRKHISLSASHYALLMRLMLAASWHLHALKIRWNYSPIICDKLQHRGKFVQ